MPNGQQPLQVSAPGWDDVVHIVPEKLMPPGERGRRRSDRIRRIRASPQPEIAMATQEFLAAYDDIQDAFVTLAIIARLGVRFYPPAERIARWLGGSADILNAGQNFQTIATLTKTDKRRLAGRFRALPNTYKLRLAESIRTRRFGVRATELLQAAQTSDTLLGVGVSLGAIMSFPVQASSLAITGGDLRLQPFPSDPKQAAEFLGPWEKSMRLRSNPPLRLQVEAAKAEVLPRRRQEINYLLGEIASSLGRPISLTEALLISPEERREVPRRFVQRLRHLNSLGDALRPQDLQAELDRDVTVTMLPALGVPAIIAHFFPPPTSYDAVERIRANSATLRPQLLDRGIESAWISAAAGELDPAAFQRLLFVPAAAALRAAARVLNKWKVIAPAKDDLTGQEHLDMLAALNLAWQVAGPIFSVFDYDAPRISDEQLEVDHLRFTDSLNTWGDRLSDSPMRDIAQQLVADTARLIISHLDEPGIPVRESLTPMAGAVVRLVEIGAVGKSGSPLGGSRIDPGSLPALLGRDIFEALSDGERALLADQFGQPS